MNDVASTLAHASFDGLHGEAIAVGVAVGGTVEIAYGRRLSDHPVVARTVLYGASLTKQIVG